MNFFALSLKIRLFSRCYLYKAQKYECVTKTIPFHIQVAFNILLDANAWAYSKFICIETVSPWKPFFLFFCCCAKSGLFDYSRYNLKYEMSINYSRFDKKFIRKSIFQHNTKQQIAAIIVSAYFQLELLAMKTVWSKVFSWKMRPEQCKN